MTCVLLEAYMSSLAVLLAFLLLAAVVIISFFHILMSMLGNLVDSVLGNLP